MKFIFIYCFLLLLLIYDANSQVLDKKYLASSNIKAGEYIRFDKINIENEHYKKSSDKSVILHDSQGYVWIRSTRGNNEELIRYDGNYYKTFTGKNWNLWQAPSGKIFGNNNNGLVVFDSKNEIFRTFKNPYATDQTIYSNILGKHEDCWFTERNGKFALNKTFSFYRFDSKKQQFTKYLPKSITNAYTQQLLPYWIFNPLYVGEDSLVWGVFLFKDKSSSLGYFDPKSGNCFCFPNPKITAPDININETLFSFLSIVEAEGKYLWMSHIWSQSGLIRFNTETHEWTQYIFPAINQNRINGIFNKNEDELWLKNGDGLMVFHKKTEKCFYYKNEINNEFSLSAFATSISYHKNGTLWFGLENSINNSNIYFLDIKNQPFHQSNIQLPNNGGLFRALYKQNNKLYYSFNTTEAIEVAEYNYLTKVSKTLWKHPFGKVSYQNIYRALNDTINHKIWLVGNTEKDGAIFILDTKKGKVLPLNFSINTSSKNVINSKDFLSIRAICQDIHGNVWLGIFLSKHRLILKFSHKKQQFETIFMGERGLPFDQPQSMLVDSKGRVWIGFSTGRLGYFEESKQNFILHNSFKVELDAGINRLVEDTKRNVIWVGRFEKGLRKLDLKTNTHIKVKGFSEVYSLHSSSDGFLWVLTSTGIIKYNPDNGQKLSFEPEYGIGSFDWTPMSKTQDDDFFYGKIHFFNHDIKLDTTKPIIKFSSVNVFDKPIISNLNEIKQLNLNYDQNFFTIGFSILSYFQKEKNQYYYQLEGFNENWVNARNRPLATFTNVPHGEYILKIKGSNNNGISSNIKLLKIVIKPAYWQTWWFKVLLFILFLAIIYSIYNFQLKQKTLQTRLKTEEAIRKQRESELQQRIVETELSALRAQMNPHFIFNCLNSIQLFTAQNEADKASEFLTKFSRLIRLVLENSRSEKVTLENEIETLKLYLEMETMRFKGKVNFKIKIDKNVDVNFIQIPPLLVQPFVENSIWHGLMHKEEGGNVYIDFSQSINDSLIIVITDNGIGREKALEYKSKSATKNKSFGMKVTTERIELINQIYNTTTTVEIIDLKDRLGQPTGTKVIVEIPI